MGTLSEADKAEVKKVFEYATNLLLVDKRPPAEVKNLLVEAGSDDEGASYVVESIMQTYRDITFKKAKNDMRYGALWCMGGIMATAAHIGFIFWGAILFGAFQFLKGLVNSGWLKGTIYQSDET